MVHYLPLPPGTTHPCCGAGSAAGAVGLIDTREPGSGYVDYSTSLEKLSNAITNTRLVAWYGRNLAGPGNPTRGERRGAGPDLLTGVLSKRVRSLVDTSFPIMPDATIEAKRERLKIALEGGWAGGPRYGPPIGYILTGWDHIRYGLLACVMGVVTAALTVVFLK